MKCERLLNYIGLLDHLNGHKYRIIEQSLEEPPQIYLLYPPMPVVNHSHQINLLYWLQITSEMLSLEL